MGYGDGVFSTAWGGAVANPQKKWILPPKWSVVVHSNAFLLELPCVKQRVPGSGDRVYNPG